MKNEQTILEKAKEKRKQLDEAVNLLDDLGFRITWALDFSKFESINEILKPLSYQLDEAQTHLEELLEEIDEEIENYQIEKIFNEKEFDSQSSLAYNLT